MKVRYIFDRVCFQRVNFCFLKNINLFESTAAMYNGKIVDTGAMELPLIHVYINLLFWKWVHKHTHNCLKLLSSNIISIDPIINLNLDITVIIVKLTSLTLKVVDLGSNKTNFIAQCSGHPTY